MGDRLASIPLPALVLAVGALLGALVALVILGDRDPTGSEPARPVAAPGKSAPAATALAPTLRQGDSGEHVRGLQAALGLMGLVSSPPDGFFGKGTRDALGSFQAARGLAADGVAGPATSGALAAALAEIAKAEAATAEQGLADALDAGLLSPQATEQHRKGLGDALAGLEALPLARRAYVVVVLRDVASHASTYDGPRALALFTMLEANARYLRGHPLPRKPIDVEGADGVVYRFFPAHGFQFHPLANFVRLNGYAAQRRRQETARLAQALVARGIPAGDALTWEYFFPFGGPSRWTSGFAQATAAQALARSGKLLGDEKLRAQAKAAFREIPATLTRELGGGLWIREYGFSDSAILNAQLQSLVAVSEYAETTGDAWARMVAAELSQAAQALLPRFDTGCWSLYALDGNPASPGYHSYHVRLLRKLARGTDEVVWRETAARWEQYRREPSCA
ncbi:MAG: D-glucuronyl C5-epimerase family protein [Gaiellaceae bacterium]